jgi:putative hydrolase of the HAD superfamily
VQVPFHGGLIDGIPPDSGRTAHARPDTAAMRAVQGIILDAGGVLVALDGAPGLSRLLGTSLSVDDFHRRWLACPSVLLHETGRMSAERFAEQIVAELGLTISPSEFLADFAGWFGGVIPGVSQLVERIPGQYRVAILSNMSAFHWRMAQAAGLPSRIDLALVSCETGVLKPDPSAFHLVARAMQLDPRELLMLDDSSRNVAAACSLDFEAEVVSTPDQIESALRQYGVL